MLRFQPDLKSKYYDNDSWSVITGGSDGIGLEIAHQTAAQGFNICIIGRNETKINEKLAEIKSKNPTIKTMCIVFDFNKYFTI